MARLSKQIRSALAFEQKRKRLISLGKLSEARQTYQKQVDFFPDENTGQFWDEYYGKVDHQTEYPMETWKLNQVIRFLEGQKNILNIGVGDGKLEQRIVEVQPSAQLTGIDFTQKLLRRVRKKFPQFKFVFQSDITHLAVKDASFDQVTLLEVLEHIIPKHTFDVLGEIHRILTPGGRLFISVPINEGLEEMLPTNPNSHMRLYSESLLRFELEQSGFIVDRMLVASAFSRFFGVKHRINSIFHFRKPNNLLVIARKS